MRDEIKDEFYAAVYEIANEVFDDFAWDTVSIDDYNNENDDWARHFLFQCVDEAIDSTFTSLVMKCRFAALKFDSYYIDNKEDC